MMQFMSLSFTSLLILRHHARSDPYVHIQLLGRDRDFATRGELCCLKPKEWISDTVSLLHFSPMWFDSFNFFVSMSFLCRLMGFHTYVTF